MRGYSILYRSSGFEYHYQIQFSIIPRTSSFLGGAEEGGHTPLKDIQSTYTKPNRQDVFKKQCIHNKTSITIKHC